MYCSHIVSRYFILLDDFRQFITELDINGSLVDRQ